MSIKIRLLTSNFYDFILSLMNGEDLKFLSVAETAERLGLTRSRVNQLISKGVLPATRVGRSFMINERDLNSAKERNTKKTGRPPKAKVENKE
jgi:excisionase family DNA binding protein